jgi:hypothetical protein
MMEACNILIMEVYVRLSSENWLRYMQDKPWNQLYVLTARPDGKSLSETEFIRELCNLRIHLLIGADALVLELDNRSLLRQWLDIDPKAPASVRPRKNT